MLTLEDYYEAAEEMPLEQMEGEKMLQQIDVEKCKGKTIAESFLSSTRKNLFLTFTDGTFFLIGINRGYEAGDEEIENENFSLRDFYTEEKVIQSGIITQQEVDHFLALRRARDEEDKRKTELRERALLEQLKQKYGE